MISGMSTQHVMQHIFWTTLPRNHELAIPASQVAAPISFIFHPGDLPHVGTGRRRTQNIPALHRCMSSKARASMDQRRGLKQMGVSWFHAGHDMGIQSWGFVWFMGVWDLLGSWMSQNPLDHMGPHGIVTMSGLATQDPKYFTAHTGSTIQVLRVLTVRC
jgi:hypothetical protein